MRFQVLRVTGLALIGIASASGPTLADPKDYRFEAVRPDVAVSPSAALAVRLIHLPSGKPVTDAILFQPKMVMPMEGMAPMPTRITPAPSDGKGTYPFLADIGMEGPWTLTLSAKVQGEPATITGSVPFTARPSDHGAAGMGAAGAGAGAAHGHSH
jgi:hypothetical protein